MQKENRLALFLALCLLLLPLHTLPLQAEETATQKSTEVGTPAAATMAGEEGIASYYAKRYNGRKTHSGARYRPEGLTAASPDLPLGCRVRVINLESGEEVLVTINDRCRRKKTPFIDLSRAAAKKLGFLGNGTARVRIIPLDDDESLRLSCSK
jgi:rare lipoprotein A